MLKCVRRSDDGRREAERNSLADRLVAEAKVLADLKIEKVAVEGNAPLSAPISGPSNLAILLRQADEVVLRWFILVVAFRLDPAAVLLLLAATRTRS
jgi:hypothetical protein